MKGYRIFTRSKYGFDSSEFIYTTNYNTAVQKFNDLLRKVVKESNGINREDFGERVQDYRESISRELNKSNDEELICRKCPFIITKDNKGMYAEVFMWELISYECDEWDISSEGVILEEIEILS